MFFAQKYSLPTAYDLMERPPTKGKWKAMPNKAVEEHHMTEWYNEVEDKTSLKVPHTAKTPNHPWICLSSRLSKESSSCSSPLARVNASNP
jgi:hypothetical protein